jgi:hypothetical protein
MLARLLGISAGAELALLTSHLLAQVIPIVPGSTPPVSQAEATIVVARYIYYIAFALFGSGAWALSRPSDMKPYFLQNVKFPTVRMVFTGFAWGMFIVAVGEWRGWSQGLTTAMVFLVSLLWEFMMIAAVWLGRRFSSNPVQFWQDMRLGRIERERRAREEFDLDDTQARARHDGELH